MTLIGKKAPSFHATAVHKGKFQQHFSLDNFRGKYVIFFFYPLDFTFVCPTELHAFQHAIEEFQNRNAQLVGCSVDSQFSHAAWLNTPKTKGGIEGIEYPIVADLNKTIAQQYGVLKEDEGIAYRGLFLLDKDGIVRHQVVNDLPFGRSVEETIRMLDAVIFHEKHGEVCPANWKEGNRALKPTQQGVETYFQ